MGCEGVGGKWRGKKFEFVGAGVATTQTPATFVLPPNSFVIYFVHLVSWAFFFSRRGGDKSHKRVGLLGDSKSFAAPCFVLLLLFLDERKSDDGGIFVCTLKSNPPPLRKTATMPGPLGLGMDRRSYRTGTIRVSLPSPAIFVGSFFYPRS